jgi:hypothetical protein
MARSLMLRTPKHLFGDRQNSSGIRQSASKILIKQALFASCLLSPTSHNTDLVRRHFATNSAPYKARWRTKKKHVSATTWAEYVYRIQPLIIWSWRQMTRSTKIYSNFTIHNQIHIQWQFTDWEIEKIRNRDVCPAVRFLGRAPRSFVS